MKVINYIKNNKFAVPVFLIGLVTLYFLFVYNSYSDLNNRESEVFWWMEDSWNERNNLEHGYFVPFAFIMLCVVAYRSSKEEPRTKGIIGIVALVIGFLLYLASVRTIQPRLALIGLPFLISGSIIYVMGWAKGKHFLFASFFWYFALPVPGLNQLTNGLQVFVTQSCFEVGTLFGMELVQSGNNIKSATGAWTGFDIAEGCSGIKSLMALIMIAALYAYFTQNKLWKKILVFASAFPLAIVGNFFRIFTILVLAEMGFVDFAKGAYHDWAGLLIFFPVALSGLFLVDKAINRRKIVTKTTIKN